MRDWKHYKNIGPWPLIFQQDRPYYNEGNRISSAYNPVWTTEFTGKPITPTHNPWCGYWHDHPEEDYNKGLQFDYNLYYPEPFGDPCIKDPNIAWDYDNSASVVDINSIANIAITGLNAPFSWKVTGIGFSLVHRTTVGLENQLIVAFDGCGSATITVTGCDGEQTIGYVRCVVGVWSDPIEGCAIVGDWDSRAGNAFKKTLGNIQQYQLISPTIEHGDHCGAEPCSATCAIFGNFLTNCLTISCADFGYAESSCSEYCCGDPCDSGICWMMNDEPCQENIDCPGGTSCGKTANCKCIESVFYYIWGCP